MASAMDFIEVSKTVFNSPQLTAVSMGNEIEIFKNEKKQKNKIILYRKVAAAVVMEAAEVGRVEVEEEVGEGEKVVVVEKDEVVEKEEVVEEMDCLVGTLAEGIPLGHLDLFS